MICAIWYFVLTLIAFSSWGFHQRQGAHVSWLSWWYFQAFVWTLGRLQWVFCLWPLGPLGPSALPSRSLLIRTLLYGVFFFGVSRSKTVRWRCVSGGNGGICPMTFCEVLLIRNQSDQTCNEIQNNFGVTRVLAQVYAWRTWRSAPVQ